jgi:hypothetical protein
MSGDIVAELDRWLATEVIADDGNPISGHLIAKWKVERARDEIVALRTHVLRETEAIRANALEEAACVCERRNPRSPKIPTGGQFAADIRALKDQR